MFPVVHCKTNAWTARVCSFLTQIGTDFRYIQGVGPQRSMREFLILLGYDSAIFWDYTGGLDTIPF